VAEEVKSDFRCGCAFKVNAKNPALRAYGKEKVTFLLMGHANGQVHIYKDYKYQGLLFNYNVLSL
jgi:hypothetical protein